MNNTAFIELLYRTVLGREPDKEGLASHVAALEQGADPRRIMEDFQKSEELVIRRARAEEAKMEEANVAEALLHDAAGRQYVIVDIGAQTIEGTDHIYTPLTERLPHTKIIGFEPQSDRCEARYLLKEDRNLVIHPIALGDGSEQTLYINNDPGTTSLLPLNSEFLKLFDDLRNIEPRTTETLTTQSLDSVLDGEDHIDLLKLDVQGFELEILKHATNVLKNTRAIHCEVSFSPMYKGQCLFEDIAKFLKGSGWEFIDFTHFCKYRHHDAGPQSPRDRLVWADAFFLRSIREGEETESLISQGLTSGFLFEKWSIASHLLQRARTAGDLRPR